MRSLDEEPGFVIEIPGRPVAKQRARYAVGRKPYTPPRTRAYEDTVAWACKARRLRILPGLPLFVSIELHTTSSLRGDLDNYAKSILDGIQKGGGFANDRQVKRLEVRSVDALEDKAVVRIMVMTDDS